MCAEEATGTKSFGLERGMRLTTSGCWRGTPETSVNIPDTLLSARYGLASISLHEALENGPGA
jgi:hypothetical protein